MPITEFPAGGLGAGFAPEEWAAYVLDNLSAASVVLASGATEIRTTGKAVHVPRFTATPPRRGMTNWKKSEKVRRPAWTWCLTPKKVAALATISNETVADSNSNVLKASGRRWSEASRSRPTGRCSPARGGKATHGHPEHRAGASLATSAPWITRAS